MSNDYCTAAYQSQRCKNPQKVSLVTDSSLQQLHIVSVEWVCVSNVHTPLFAHHTLLGNYNWGWLFLNIFCTCINLCVYVCCVCVFALFRPQSRTAIFVVWTGDHVLRTTACVRKATSETTAVNVRVPPPRHSQILSVPFSLSLNKMSIISVLAWIEEGGPGVKSLP